MTRLFDELKEGLTEALAYVRGENTGARVRIIEPNEIQQLRAKAGLTQSQFAEMIGASIGTVRKWEQGLRKPSGAAKTLLRIVAHRMGPAKRRTRQAA
jgi:putative transcriptional regulator